MKQNMLSIFAKNPIVGKVKTRLAASIGPDAAFNVYKELVEYTAEVAQNVRSEKIVFYSDRIEENDAWGNGFLKAVQKGNDMGERMMNAFKDVLQGSQKAVIIGTDCPSLTESIIEEAFEKLTDVDVVIGPAFDGGYYLLGLKSVYSFLFDGIEWSTSLVLQQTINRCKQNSLSYELLQELHDVDEEKDLVHLKK